MNVSDEAWEDGYTQGRGDERAALLADAERCWSLLNKPSGEMTPDDWNELREHPLRFSGRELPKWIDWLRATGGDTHPEKEDDHG